MTNEQSIEDVVRALLQQKKMKTGERRSNATNLKDEKKVQEPKRAPRVESHGRYNQETGLNPRLVGQLNTSAVVGEEIYMTTRTRSEIDRRDGQMIEVPILQKILDRINLTETGRAPSKRAVKHMARRKMIPGDRVFGRDQGCGPGSSRSVTLDAIRAIAAKGDGPDNGTGCIVRDETAEIAYDRKGRKKLAYGALPNKPMTATTTRDSGNVVAGYQIIEKQ